MFKAEIEVGEYAEEEDEDEDDDKNEVDDLDDDRLAMRVQIFNHRSFTDLGRGSAGGAPV